MKNKKYISLEIQQLLAWTSPNPYRPPEIRIAQLARKIAIETIYPFQQIKNLIESLIGRSKQASTIILNQYRIGTDHKNNVLNTIYKYLTAKCPYCEYWQNNSCSADWDELVEAPCWDTLEAVSYRDEKEESEGDGE